MVPQLSSWNSSTPGYAFEDDISVTLDTWVYTPFYWGSTAPAGYFQYMDMFGTAKTGPGSPSDDADGSTSYFTWAGPSASDKYYECAEAGVYYISLKMNMRSYYSLNGVHEVSPVIEFL